MQYQYEWQRVDNQVKAEGTVTLSCVGSVVEHDEPCRWIELKEVIDAGREKRTSVYKMLVREKDLRESGNPLGNVLRTWFQENGEPPRPVNANRERFDAMLGALLLWTPGVLKGTRAGDKVKDIDYQAGRLKRAQSRSGQVALVLRNADETSVRDWSRRFLIWHHAELPIGFAEAEIHDDISDPETKRVVNQQRTVYRLQDAGANAKSALPDRN